MSKQENDNKPGKLLLEKQEISRAELGTAMGGTLSAIVSLISRIGSRVISRAVSRKVSKEVTKEYSKEKISEIMGGGDDEPKIHVRGGPTKFRSS